jgi:hypothetical protein
MLRALLSDIEGMYVCCIEPLAAQSLLADDPSGRDQNEHSQIKSWRSVMAVTQARFPVLYWLRLRDRSGGQSGTSDLKPAAPATHG